jgi:hypothetical protein
VSREISIDFRITFLLKKLRIYRLDVALSVAIVYVHSAALFNAEHASQPFGHRDTKETSLHFGNAARTIDQFTSACIEWNAEHQLAIDFLNRPLK